MDRDYLTSTVNEDYGCLANSKTPTAEPCLADIIRGCNQRLNDIQNRLYELKRNLKGNEPCNEVPKRDCTCFKDEVSDLRDSVDVIDHLTAEIYKTLF